MGLSHRFDQVLSFVFGHVTQRKYQNGDSRMNRMSCAISRLDDLTNGLYFGSAHWLILPRTGGLDRLRAERHINISAWLRSLLTRELDGELGPDGDPPTPLPPPSPLPPPAPPPRAGPGGGSAARLAASPSGQRGLGAPYYLGDPAALPPELAGATIVVQSRNGQSWITTVTTVLDRGSNQVTDAGPAVDTLISGSCPVE